MRNHHHRAEMETLTGSLLDVAVANRTHSGEGESGDLYLAEPYPGGMLVAVIDGVGHGIEAAKVAQLAVSTLKCHLQEPVDELIRYCHTALRATRGVVLALASFNARTRSMTWTGVGNVEGKLFSRSISAAPLTLLSASGTLGQGQAIAVYPSEVPIHPGDTLILATDGVRSDFYLGLDMRQSPRQLADRILQRSGLRSDDAMVVVARYAGLPA